MKKPERQPIELTPLIEEHNEVILLCERIREGLQKSIEPKRIKKYIDWFRKAYLEPHFEIEKNLIFPIIGNNNVRVKRALANHRRLNRLLDETAELNKVLHKIEEELTTYIGFEERTLYSEIKALSSESQWREIQKIHDKLDFSDDKWEDRFWESDKNNL